MNVIEITSYTVFTSPTVNTITLKTTTPLSTLSDRKNYKFIIRPLLPAITTPIKQVYITDGTTTMTMFTRFGNYVYLDQLTAKKCYCVVYGNNPKHINFNSPLPCSNFIPVVAQSTSNKEEETAPKTKKK